MKTKRSLLCLAALLYAFTAVKAQDQNKYRDTYNKEYNRITDYYNNNKANVTTGTYTPNYNNNTYSSGSYGSYGNNSFNSTYTPTYPDPSSSTYYVYANLHFARTADEQGVNTKFRVSEGDGVIYGFVTHPGGVKTLSFTVEFYKMVNDRSTLMDKITYTTDSKDYTKVWFAYDYSKFGAGKYNFNIYTPDNRLITTGSLTIKADYSSDEPSDNLYAGANALGYLSPDRDRSSPIYKSSKVVFASSADANNNAVGVYDNFVLVPGAGFVKVFIYNDAGMNTDLLRVNVYKKSKNYYEFMEKFEFPNVTPTWTYYIITYDFSKFGAGEYRFDIGTRDYVHINAGYVVIKNP